MHKLSIFFLLLSFLFSSSAVCAEELNEEWKVKLEYARLLSYMKRFEESEKKYQDLLKEKPDSDQVKLELAKIFYYQNKSDQALHLLKQIPEKQMTPEAELLLADLLVSQNDFSTAEKLYKKYLHEDPALHDEILLKIADVQSWQKNYEQSLANFEILLEKYPDDIQLRRKYAFVLLWSGQNEKAAKELEATFDTEPVK